MALMLHLWHLVTCRYSKTLRVVDRLRGLDRVSEVCCPIRPAMMFNGGLHVIRDVPWLGAMVLARWDGDDAISWYDVRVVDGVTGIVGGWPPATVRDDEVTNFLSRIEELSADGVVFVDPTCAVGDIVEFSYLSFYRVLGECCGFDGAAAVVKIMMLGREKVVLVPFEFITVVEEAPSPEVRRIFARHMGQRSPLRWNDRPRVV